MKTKTTGENTKTVYELKDDSTILVNNAIVEGQFLQPSQAPDSSQKIDPQKAAEAIVASASQNLDVGQYTMQYLKTIIEQAQDLPLNAWKLFVLYMGLIDPAKSDVNIIRLSFSEYIRYIGLSKDTRASDIDKAVNALVGRPYKLKTPNSFQTIALFDSVDVTDADDTGQRYIEIRCSEAAKPVLFFADPQANKSLRLQDGKVVKKSIPQYTSVETKIVKTTDIAKARFYMLMKSWVQRQEKCENTVSILELTEYLYGDKYFVMDNYGRKESRLTWDNFKRNIKNYIAWCRTEQNLEVGFTPLNRAGLGGKYKSIKFEIVNLVPGAEPDILKLSDTEHGTIAGTLHEYGTACKDEVYKINMPSPDLPMWADLLPGMTLPEIELISAALRNVPEAYLPYPQNTSQLIAEDAEFRKYELLQQLIPKWEMQIERGKVKYDSVSYLVGMINKIGADY